MKQEARNMAVWASKKTNKDVWLRVWAQLTAVFPAVFEMLVESSRAKQNTQCHSPVFSRWWFQPVWKKSQWESSPNRSVIRFWEKLEASPTVVSVRGKTISSSEIISTSCTQFWDLHGRLLWTSPKKSFIFCKFFAITISSGASGQLASLKIPHKLF